MDEPVIVRGMPGAVELAALMAVLSMLAQRAATPRVPATSTTIRNEGVEYRAPTSWTRRGEYSVHYPWLAGKDGLVAPTRALAR